MFLYNFVGKDLEEDKKAAKRNVWRLRINWLFVIFPSMLKTINLICVIPTNHQFIINPGAEELNITDAQVEPGLGQSEMFYSLTFTTLFVGHTIGALLVGVLFNLVPTWYLFLASTLSYSLGYFLYALATNGAMMILSRGLAGVQSGIVDSAVFAYYAVSFDKYKESLKTLGQYNEKRAIKLKGYLFSSSAIGYTIGYIVGVVFPAILSQFPETPQFRPAAWFCVATGLAVLILQLLLFHGEATWSCTKPTLTSCSKMIPSFSFSSTHYCKILVPMYIIVVGGLKGVRYLLLEVMQNPIISDSFGFSHREGSLFFLIQYTVILPFSPVILFLLQYFKLRSYGLTVLGVLCTVVSFLIMTDWQSMGSDSCIQYSLFHNPELAQQYRLELAEYNVTESGMVSIQSLQVVEDEVYQMAFNRCESAGDHCHWIPNSIVTRKLCIDCQPICRNTHHTLNFVQFSIGMVLFMATIDLYHTGVFLLLSESVSKRYQGFSAGIMMTLTGVSRSIFPFILDYVYESEEKRTYLSMLVQVMILIPVLIGLFLLYPWLAGSRKIHYSQDHDNKDGHKQ